MMPIQIGLGDFLSTATNSTNFTGDATVINDIIGRLLGIVYYIVLAGLFVAIVWYGAQLALGERPDEAKKKLIYVGIAFLVVVLLPRMIDWITGL